VDALAHHAVWIAGVLFLSSLASGLLPTRLVKQAAEL
jgi:hypothetical protein